MGWLVLIVLVALPVAELALLVQIGGEIGVANTIGLLLLVSVVGVWLAQKAGLGVVNRLRRALDEGRTPDREVADGFLVLLAGVLLVLPGFITDLLGIALLFPPTRAVVRAAALRRMARSRGVVVVGGGRSRDHGIEEIWDVESWEDTPTSRPRRQLGGEPDE